jgi:hypothetical protein
MLATAFKEWAVICRALATGRQSLIVRKGGISEAGGVFAPEHSRFWLYPTHFHEQQQKGVKPSAMQLLDEAEREKAPAGTLHFTAFVEITEVFFVDKLDVALSLDDLHVWSPETIAQRFHYRTPGLYVLPVRAWRTPRIEVPEHPAYAGCKTWVELDRTLTEVGEAVLSDAEHQKNVNAIRERIIGRP